MIIEINFGKGFAYKKTKNAKVIRFGFFYVVLLRRNLQDIKFAWEQEAKHTSLKSIRDLTPDILNYKAEEELKPFLAVLDLTIEATKPQTGYQYPKYRKEL